MSDLVLDAITEELAKLVRLVPTPVAPFGYGRDLSCVTDVTDRLDEVDPDSVRGLGEALLRRLITPRGALPDDPEYGFDVTGYCNSGVTLQDLRSLEQKVASELRKDDRVRSVVAKVTWVPNRLDVRVTVEPEIPSADPFRLTLAVENGAVLLAEVNR